MSGIKEYKLLQPSLEEVAKVLQENLVERFSYVDVQVTECPNLKEKPYMLSSEGLCGTPTIADVGGVEYLIPLAQEDKVYNLKEIANKIGIPNASIIGATAGPRHHVGINCEIMINLKFGENEDINTYIAKLNKEGACELIHLKDNADFCLLGNFFISEGKPGKVLKVTAKERTGPNNFVSVLRKALAENFKEPVGLGGIFVIKNGKAKLHIMPDYSQSPLKREDLHNWFEFFDLPAPLTCLCVIVSSDPGLGLRLEHTHCFSDHGVGGHYHEDTTPETVEYEAYFNVANMLYRIDQPSEISGFEKN